MTCSVTIHGPCPDVFHANNSSGFRSILICTGHRIQPNKAVWVADGACGTSKCIFDKMKRSCF